MRSVILFLLFVCVTFAQSNYENRASLPMPQPTPAQPAQPYQTTKSGKGGNNQYWNDQVRNNMKGQHELTDE